MEILELRHREQAGSIRDGRSDLRRARPERDPAHSSACAIGRRPPAVRATARRSRPTTSPNVLYRHARRRAARQRITDTNPTLFGGIMHYVELDARNLSRWFQGAIGVNGANALNVNGFTVYFSDRRGNHNAAGAETGEYGAEDIVNPTAGGGRRTGRSIRARITTRNDALDTYGATRRACRPARALPARQHRARRGRASIRASRSRSRSRSTIVRAQSGDLLPPRAQTDQRRPRQPGCAGADDRCRESRLRRGQLEREQRRLRRTRTSRRAVIADAVTLLSSNWNDRQSFTDPRRRGTAGGHRHLVSACRHRRQGHLVPVGQRHRPGLRHRRRRAQLSALHRELGRPAR